MGILLTVSAGSAAFAAGLFLLLSDIFRVPPKKASVAVIRSYAKSPGKTGDAGGKNGFFRNLSPVYAAEWLSGVIRLPGWLRDRISSECVPPESETTPEKFAADLAVRSLLCAALVLPLMLISPALGLLSPVAFAGCAFVRIGQAKKEIRKKREKIEAELPAFTAAVSRSLRHSRDVAAMLESYAKNAEGIFGDELRITAADMRSGSQEAALARLEARTGSPLMSDVCRGLEAVLRGDDTGGYFAALLARFSELNRASLRERAMKVPKKIRRLSVCLLFTFMLMYAVVMVGQIAGSLFILFA